MGADIFRNVAHGATAAEAFRDLVRAALAAYGNAGYTGTVAEKPGFKLMGEVTPVEVRDFWAALDGENVDEINPRVAKLAKEAEPVFDDKWGPAVCLKIVDDKPEQRWFFCGWAST